MGVTLISYKARCDKVRGRVRGTTGGFNTRVVLPRVSLSCVSRSCIGFKFSTRDSDLGLVVTETVTVIRNEYGPSTMFVTAYFEYTRTTLMEGRMEEFVRGGAHVPMIACSFAREAGTSRLFVHVRTLTAAMAHEGVLTHRGRRKLALNLSSNSAAAGTMLVRGGGIVKAN